jgi:uncharacterized membrane protein
MYPRIKLFGRVVHPLVIALPLSLYGFSLISFLNYQFLGDPLWFRIGIATDLGGVALGFLVLSIALLDWNSVRADSPAKQTGLGYLLLSLAAAGVFLGDGWLQLPYWIDPPPISAAPAIILSLVGMSLMIAAVWSSVALLTADRNLAGTNESTRNPEQGALRRVA